MICKGCVYYNVCGDDERQISCDGRKVLELPDVIQSIDVITFARKYMDKSEIDHHWSDLYLKATPVSKAITERVENKDFWVSTFIDNINHELWYEIPFAYYKEEGGETNN